MTLLIPLGLLGLLSIIGLIIIYILKPKYQDKKVSSTYIWKLSMKYVKRKVPFQWIQNSLLFLIQLIILVLIALTMSMPHAVLASKSGEKVVVLDASASMTATDGSRSRFERAKNEISAMIDETTENHKISIILATDDATFVIRRSDSATFAKQKLFEAECAMTQSNLDAAMTLAEGVLEENPTTEVYLFTDRDWEESGNVTVRNMASSEWNAAILDFTAVRNKGVMVFTAKIASYGRAADIAVGLNVDGKTQYPKLASVDAGGEVEVVWDNLKLSTYGTATVTIDSRDSFSSDNSFTVHSSTAERFKVQLVSSNGGFLSGALHATDKCVITTIDPNADPDATMGEVKEPETSGYDLYIYDGFLPEEIPTDGTLWLVNPPKELGAEYGITLGQVRETDKERPYYLESASVSSTAKQILKSVSPSSIMVTKYTRVINYEGYETIMSINEGDPALLVKDVDGLRTVVIPFDLHFADFPLAVGFPLFINNLCSYSMQNTVEKTIFSIGEEVLINAKPDTVSLKVDAEYGDGTKETLEYTNFPVRLKADRAGDYTVTQLTATGRNVVSSFYVRIAEDESKFGVAGATLANPIVPFGSGTDTTIKNNTADISVYLLAAMLVLICVEWVLQYREQY